MPRPHAKPPASFFWDCEAASEFNLQRIAAESFVRGIAFRRRIGSTNDLALQLASDRVPTPLLVIAEEQRVGRGRGTNRWWSAPGALTFSLVLESGSLKPEHWPRVALTAAVAVCEVLEPLVPQVPCGIRWPNDVDLAGRKVCGVLPELPPRATTDISRRLVLGVGINLNNSLRLAPRNIQAVGTSLFDLTGKRHDSTDFLLQLLRQLAIGLDALARNHPVLGEAWSQRCLLRGRSVELQAGPIHVRGLCRGIDSDGALVLLTDAGPQRFLGGRVEHYSETAAATLEPLRRNERQ